MKDRDAKEGRIGGSQYFTEPQTGAGKVKTREGFEEKR